MSKIEAGSLEQAIMRDLDHARGEDFRCERAGAKVDENRIREMIEKMLQKEQLSGSSLLKLDLAASTAQLRLILNDELLKVLQQVPDFVTPQMSQPPTPDDTKQLLKLMQGMEVDGTLEKHDAFARAKEERRPEGARGGIFQRGTDDAPQLKNWGQFVQSPTNAQTTRDAQALSREGLGEGQAPHELLAKDISLRQDLPQAPRGAGIRTPTLVGDGFAGVNNKQKLDIMRAGFGNEMAMTLKQAGVRDPAQLAKLGATPEGREQLSKQLGIPRAQLVVHMARAEMLSIGAGTHGEQALRPQHLPALQSANIVTQTHLAAVNSMPSAHFNQIFQAVRKNFSGFARAMSGDRPVLKKDLHHWAKTAAKRKSSILDADWEQVPHGKGEAEELIMGWYLEHFAEIEEKTRQADEQNTALEEERLSALKRGEVELSMPNSQFDPERNDGLVCFWIERPNLDFHRPTLSEMVYVCLDPKTGLIDAKQKE